jgi:hypothetical protein
MAIKYNNIFQSKGLNIFPKWGFFGLKMNHLATPLRKWVSDTLQLCSKNSVVKFNEAIQIIQPSPRFNL